MKRARATLAAVLLLAAGCGGGAAGTQPVAGPAPDTSAGASSGPPASSAPASSAASTSSLPAWGGTATISAPPEATAASHLRAVALGRHPGFDRIVLRFRGGLPGFRVGYVRPPIVGAASGAPLHVLGRAFLELRLEPATAAGGSVPQRLGGRAAGTASVRELVRTGDFEAVLTSVAGLRRRSAFRVFTLHRPTRIVIDVRT